MNISRYDPRKDIEGLKELARAFADRSYSQFDEKKFEAEISARVLDLKLRNSIVLARNDEDKIIGAGIFSLFKDNFGNPHCIIHQVMTYKEDSFKLGIEEIIIKEMFKYLKNTMNITNIGLHCMDKDSQYRSVLMKLGINKSKYIFYDYELK